jgi:transglutaminase/protease-like cytokinesis protein 3
MNSYKHIIRKYFLIFFIFFLSGIILGQNKTLPKKSYIDSVVDTMDLKNETEPIDLAYLIAEPFKTDSEKVRAIFYWMTQNIAYDYQSLLNKKYATPFYGDNLTDLTDYYYKRIYHTILTKKGVCEDYALVFQYLCKTNKIPCEMVIGYALVVRPSNYLKLALTEDESNHAWNAVMINKKWYLIDVTFASGYIDLNKIRFVRKLNNFYYLTPPKDLILDHHPVDSRWQLLDKPLDIKSFIENAKYNREKNIEPIDTIKINKQIDSSKVQMHNY